MSSSTLDPSDAPESSAFFVEPPDISHIVTEDDEPVDNWFSEKQMRLLAESLNLSWRPGRPFIAAANVGIFYGLHIPPVVPDVFVALDVQLPEDIWEKRNRSYFVWEYGKVPEAVVEIASNAEGGERDRKYEIYEKIRALYFVIYDPMKFIQNEPLRIFELNAGQYVPRIDKALPQIGLKLTLWNGVYEGRNDCWLRWCDAEGNLLLNGAERSEIAEQRADTAEQIADTAQQRADTAEQRAETAERRAEQLAKKLKELGIEPD